MDYGKIGIKKLVLFAVLSTVMAMAIFTFSVSAAAASLELHVEPGLGGQVKASEDIPVKFTLTNNGTAIEGYLTVRYAGSSSQNTVMSRALTVPQNSSQEVWLTLPGRTYTERNNEIVFMTGHPVNGKAIPFADGKQSLHIPPIQPQTLQVGVFAANRDAYNFLNLLGQDGHEIRIHRLEADAFSVELLEQLDVLAINDYSGEHFSVDELGAIEAWLHRGGMLILSGGAGYTKIGEPLLSLSPVQYSGTETVHALESLEQITEQQINAGSGVTLVRGELTKGQALLTENNLPLFAQSGVGQGHVLFVAYDVSLEPFASWNGNPQLWERMLQAALAKSSAQGNQYFDGNSFWELERALDFFPQLKAPAFGWMALIFFIYIIVVAPLLYLLLKRIDKRGWAWFIIPSMALIFSLAIYIVGAWDRNETLAQHLEFVELYGDGMGHRTAATSYFVPRGGDYSISYGPTQKISSLSDKTTQHGTYELGGSMNELITKDTLSFYGVPFWSIRKAWVEDNQLETYGDLKLELHFSGSAIVGEVTNETNADLEDVHIIYQHTVQEIGSLARAESKKIQLALRQTPNSHYRNIGYELFGPQGRDNELRHKRAMAVALFQREMPAISVIGYSTDQERVQIEDDEVLADIYKLWFKAAELSFVHEGQIRIPYGTITPYVTSFDDKGSSQPYQIFDGQIEMGEGELELVYPLPLIEQAEYDQLVVGYSVPQPVTLAIWNESLAQWEQLNNNGSSASYSDPEGYTQQGVVRFKIVHSQGYDGFQLPDIMLEGRQSDD